MNKTSAPLRYMDKRNVGRVLPATLDQNLHVVSRVHRRIAPVVTLCMCLMLVFPGCQGLKFPSYKDKPEANWNQVRARIKRQLAQKQLDSGLFDDAVKSANESISLDPKAPDVYVTLARANLELNKLVAAKHALDAARNRGLQSGDLSYTEGILHEQRNQLDAACTKFAEAESLELNNIDYFIARIECLVSLNRLDEVQSLFQDAEARFDDEASIAILRARIAALTGDAEVLAQRVSTARAIIADDPIMAESFGLALLRLDRVDDAIAVLAPLASEANQARMNDSAARGLADALIRRNRYGEARDILRTHLRKNPTDSVALILHAKSALALQDYAVALDSIDQAVHAGTDRHSLDLLRATALWKHGASKEATVILEERIRMNPNDSLAFCLLGEIAVSMDHLADARSHFERARQLDPELSWAAQGLKLTDSHPN